jgi:hypothetical protein
MRDYNHQGALHPCAHDRGLITGTNKNQNILLLNGNKTSISTEVKTNQFKGSREENKIVYNPMSLLKRKQQE